MFIFIIVNSIGYFYDFGSIPKESYADSFRRYPDNKKLDLIFSQAFKYIRENIPKENSVIVAPSYLFPPVMYYLPEYDVYVFGAIKDGSSNGLYAHNFKRYKLLDFQTIKFISDSHLKGKYVVFMNERLNNQFDIKSQKEAIYLLGEWKLIVAHP